MDEYYANLVIEKLLSAQLELSKAQNYAIKADAPKWLQHSFSRIMSSLRNRQDEISRLVALNRKQRKDQR